MTVLDVKGNIGSQSKKDVDELLTEEGFVWIKNSGVSSPEEFNAQQKIFINKPMDYTAGVAVRETVLGDVLTPNQYSPKEKLDLHQELSYATRFPERIVFYCQFPATQGGQSIVANIENVGKDLPEALFNKFVKQACIRTDFFVDKYSNNQGQLSSQRYWQDAFATKDKEKAEEVAIGLGAKVTWHAENIMEIKTVLGNTILIDTSQHLLFNSIFLTSMVKRRRAEDNNTIEAAEPLNRYGYRWEGGSAISESEIEQTELAYSKNEQVIPMSAGDILVVDNLHCAHGRMPYEGERKQFVLLGDPRTR